MARASQLEPGCPLLLISTLQHWMALPQSADAAPAGAKPGTAMGVAGSAPGSANAAPAPDMTVETPTPPTKPRAWAKFVVSSAKFQLCDSARRVRAAPVVSLLGPVSWI